MKADEFAKKAFERYNHWAVLQLKYPYACDYTAQILKEFTKLFQQAINSKEAKEGRANFVK